MRSLALLALLLIVSNGVVRIRAAAAPRKETRTNNVRRRMSKNTDPHEFALRSRANDADSNKWKFVKHMYVLRSLAQESLNRIANAISSSMVQLPTFTADILSPQRSIEAHYMDFLQRETGELVYRSSPKFRRLREIYSTLFPSRQNHSAFIVVRASGNAAMGKFNTSMETNHTVRPEITESGDGDIEATEGRKRFRAMPANAEDLIRGIVAVFHADEQISAEDEEAGGGQRQDEEEEYEDDEEESDDEEEGTDSSSHAINGAVAVQSSQQSAKSRPSSGQLPPSKPVAAPEPEAPQTGSHGRMQTDEEQSKSALGPNVAPKEKQSGDLVGKGMVSSESASGSRAAPVLEGDSDVQRLNSEQTTGTGNNSGDNQIEQGPQADVFGIESSAGKHGGGDKPIGKGSGVGTPKSKAKLKEKGEEAEAISTADSNAEQGGDGSETVKAKKLGSGGAYTGSPIGMINGENVTQLSLMVYKIAKSEKLFSMAAAPCRAVSSWMPEVAMRLEFELPGFQFYCVDTDEPQTSMDDLKKAFGEISGGFVQSLPDVIDKSLPKNIELVVSWMGMQEWGIRKSWRFIKGLRRSGVRMALFSNNPKSSNAGGSEGTLNVRKSPLLFNEPQRVIGKVSEDNNKQLLLYSMDGLRDGF